MVVLYPGRIRIWRCWFLEKNPRRKAKTDNKRTQPWTPDSRTHIWHWAGFESIWEVFSEGERSPPAVPSLFPLKEILAKDNRKKIKRQEAQIVLISRWYTYVEE